MPCGRPAAAFGVDLSPLRRRATGNCPGLATWKLRVGWPAPRLYRYVYIAILRAIWRLSLGRLVGGISGPCPLGDARARDIALGIRSGLASSLFHSHLSSRESIPLASA